MGCMIQRVPMSLISRWMAIASSVASGSASISSMRRLSVTAASWKACAFCVVGAFERSRVGHAPVRRHRLAGPDRADLAGALSQTVNTKSSGGESGVANSSQLLLRKPSVGMPKFAQSVFSANGFTMPLGWLPAE